MDDLEEIEEDSADVRLYFTKSHKNEVVKFTKTLKDYIEIILAIAIIAGLFMPYIFGILPIDVMFENLMEFEAIFGLTIPILLTIPFLLILIFNRISII